MGLTERQLLWRVELPLALPEIFAGLRIATVSTVAIATLAVFVGVGLGTAILSSDIDFKTNDPRRGHSADPDGARLRRDPLLRAAAGHAVAAGGAGMTAALRPLAALGVFGDAIDFIFKGGQAEDRRRRGRRPRGGPRSHRDAPRGDGPGDAAGAGRSRCRPGCCSATTARASWLAIAIGNAGRAVPELALIAFMAVAIGVGLRNVTIALAVLAIPPILTNTFVAIRQVDRALSTRRAAWG